MLISAAPPAEVDCGDIYHCLHRADLSPRLDFNSRRLRIGRSRALRGRIPHS